MSQSRIRVSQRAFLNTLKHCSEAKEKEYLTASTLTKLEIKFLWSLPHKPHTYSCVLIALLSQQANLVIHFMGQPPEKQNGRQHKQIEKQKQTQKVKHHQKTWQWIKRGGEGEGGGGGGRSGVIYRGRGGCQCVPLSTIQVTMITFFFLQIQLLKED